MAETTLYSIEIDRLSRRFGETIALDQICLCVRRGEFFSLLGPSGCGKTTLLRIVAGLEIPDEGTVRIAGLDASGTPAYRRPVNTVFQSYALFPHLDVQENVAFGLRMKKVHPGELRERVQQAMALVEIENLAQRKPAQLSGGQKQRVALARALVNRPEVLLLDEPLAALDLKLRKQLQLELRNLQQRLGITFLYVTHDQEEALILSDRIAVMRQGQIDQLGTREELYERPRTRFTSQFLGSCTLFEGTVRPSASGVQTVETPVGELQFLGSGPRNRATITLAIRPEKVQLLAKGDRPGTNQIAATVLERVYVGAETHFRIRAGEQVLSVEIMNAQPSFVGPQPGDLVIAYLPPEALIVLND